MRPIILPVGYEVELKGDRYFGEGGWYFAPHGVQDNKLHWEEIKEPERIEVEGIFLSGGTLSNINGKSYKVYQFETNNQIPIEKIPLVKAAIERVLNNDEPSDGYNLFYVKGLNDKIEALEIIHEAYRHLSSQKLFTQQQMNEATEKAFNAARETTKYDLYPYNEKYPTFLDYIKSITT